MAEHMALPDGWSELTYEANDVFDAVWAHEDEEIMVTATMADDIDGITYSVVVEQTIEYENMKTTVESHALVAESQKEAERMAAEFMHEVNDGHHALRVMGVDEWKEFYQFYCISDSEVPGEMTADELIESIDNEAYDDDIDDLPDDYDPDEDADHVVTVDVFPRHQTEIEDINDD
jgi:hypothetical protein